jgi:hypothetical protein
MRRTVVTCNFCYQPAVHVVEQRRRALWQVVLRRPPRRADVCGRMRCRLNADDYVTGRVLGL